ncbi:substrate-binding domain-containing protein [Halothiobacillus diazotrophicus]|uniref:hypothetical protein n=1 Tax=Halothiobacillus diazotrophicus TaxID=1860122 RepID=UPI0012E7BA7C|nr:hypothetical protein [Halothiobacillus diazotrophicus]
MGILKWVMRAAINASSSSRTGRLIGLSGVGLCLLALAGCGGGTAAAVTQAVVQPIRVTSTPNPSVLPLLLAMAQDPSLPVTLLPVSNGSEIDQAFANQDAEALLAMTWVEAGKVLSGAEPDLRLVSVNFWRGFFELAAQSLGVTNFTDLTGRNILLSGPVGGGRNGGPDTLFQGALKRAGFDPTTYEENTVTVDVNGTPLSVVRRHYDSGDFRVYYLPVTAAVSVLNSGQLLDDGDGNSQNDMPASASFMVDPAATGIVMQGMMSNITYGKAIDIQTLFTGYLSWPPSELPLGGLSIRASVLDDPSRAAAVARLRAAYEKAANDLMAARGYPMQMRDLTTQIADQVNRYYGQYGLSLPAPVIAAALTNGSLVYRTDLSVNAILPDLVAFHTELLGKAPPTSFYGP